MADFEETPLYMAVKNFLETDDRLWPYETRKTASELSAWYKALTPSFQRLRQAFKLYSGENEEQKG